MGHFQKTFFIHSRKFSLRNNSYFILCLPRIIDVGETIHPPHIYSIVRSIEYRITDYFSSFYVISVVIYVSSTTWATNTAQWCIVSLNFSKEASQKIVLQWLRSHYARHRATESPLLLRAGTFHTPNLRDGFVKGREMIPRVFITSPSGLSWGCPWQQKQWALENTELLQGLA